MISHGRPIANSGGGPTGNSAGSARKKGKTAGGNSKGKGRSATVAQKDAFQESHLNPNQNLDAVDLLDLTACQRQKLIDASVAPLSSIRPMEITADEVRVQLACPAD